MQVARVGSEAHERRAAPPPSKGKLAPCAEPHRALRPLQRAARSETPLYMRSEGPLLDQSHQNRPEPSSQPPQGACFNTSALCRCVAQMCRAMHSALGRQHRSRAATTAVRCLGIRGSVPAEMMLLACRPRPAVCTVLLSSMCCPSGTSGSVEKRQCHLNAHLRFGRKRLGP